jgi:hypothetical protein
LGRTLTHQLNPISERILHIAAPHPGNIVRLVHRHSRIPQRLYQSSHRTATPDAPSSPDESRFRLPDGSAHRHSQTSNRRASSAPAAHCQNCTCLLKPRSDPYFVARTCLGTEPVSDSNDFRFCAGRYAGLATLADEQFLGQRKRRDLKAAPYFSISFALFFHYSISQGQKRHRFMKRVISGY